MSSQEIIDFHTHVYPHGEVQKSLVYSLAHNKQVEKIYAYYSSAGHLVQEKMYMIPHSLRRFVEPFSLLSVLPPIFLKSHLDDLCLEMNRHHVSQCVVVAHPPLIPNEFILTSVKEARPHLQDQNSILRPCLVYGPDFNWQQMPEKFLVKLNPLAVPFDFQSRDFHLLLSKWQDCQWPLLLHTGQLNSPFFKSQKSGDVTDYEGIVKKYDRIQFVFLHSNIFQPQRAIEMAEKYPNTFLTTSWQATENIHQACQKIGSERILFSSDWPLLGNNIELKLKGLKALVRQTKISLKDYEKICCANARCLLENYFSKNV